MGVGAEVNVGRPLRRFVPGVGLCWHLGWGWRERIGPGAEQWHAATDTRTHLRHSEFSALLQAADDPIDAPARVDAVLSASRAAEAWRDAKAEAIPRRQLVALLRACVAAYGAH